MRHYPSLVGAPPLAANPTSLLRVSPPGGVRFLRSRRIVGRQQQPAGPPAAYAAIIARFTTSTTQRTGGPRPLSTGGLEAGTLGRAPRAGSRSRCGIFPLYSDNATQPSDRYPRRRPRARTAWSGLLARQRRAAGFSTATRTITSGTWARSRRAWVSYVTGGWRRYGAAGRRARLLRDRRLCDRLVLPFGPRILPAARARQAGQRWPRSSTSCASPCTATRGDRHADQRPSARPSMSARTASARSGPGGRAATARAP